jgi:integrase
MPRRGDDPRHKYEKERQRVQNADMSERGTQAVLQFLSAFDGDDLSESYQNEKGETETLSYNSLEGYGRSMRLIAKKSDRDLLDHSLNSLSRIFEDFLEDLSVQTVRQRQAAAIKFYRFHETGIDPDEIPLKQREKDTSVDERDIFDREDIQAIRDACDNARDRCLVELLIYTGQRLRAIQTLRLKDIDLDQGTYYLNTDEGGLKGAEKVGKKRPLLGAENAVRDWMDKHPTGDRDDYLLTPLPSATNTSGEAGEYLSFPSIRSRLNTLAERAEIDKPANPHNFRHAFVTVAIREYEMDPSTVKFLIGHDQDSTVMETTYQHLTDEDHINAARRATDAGRDPDEKEGTLTPDTCPVCNEPQPPSAKACSRCGEVFTPDARAAQKNIDETMYEGQKEAQDNDESNAVDALKKELDNNPELASELVEALSDDL